MPGKTEIQELTINRTKVKHPKMFNVIMYNDDFTTMEFVVEVLVTIFKKNEKDAYQIMYGVHRGGKAVVGTYTYDIATTRTHLATSKARMLGYPFRMEVLPADREKEE